MREESDRLVLNLAIANGLTDGKLKSNKISKFVDVKLAIVVERPGIEPRSLRPLANNLPIRPMNRLNSA